MTKKHYLFALCVVIIAVFADAVFGRILAARISTLPLIRRWNLLSPQAPIVINTREQVRVSTAEDIQNGINSVKNKVASILVSGKDGYSQTGTALELTGDGIFMSVQSAFPQSGAVYKIKLASGQIVPITQLVLDPATELVIVKTDASGTSSASFAEVANLSPAETIFSIQNGNLPYTPAVSVGIISRLPNDRERQSFSADKYTSSVGTSGLGALTPGQIVCDANGDVVGLWDGARVLDANVLASALASYLQNKQSIVRLQFGFDYRMVLPNENDVIKNGFALLVEEPEKGFLEPAKKAGLVAGDIITKIGDQGIDASHFPEQLFMSSSSGAPVSLSVFRGKNLITITITPSKDTQ